MDISLDSYGHTLYALNTAFKLTQEEGPATPQQPKGGLRKWLRRHATQPSSPDKTPRRRNRGQDFGAPETGSTSQSSLLRTNGTDAVVTTQDVASHAEDIADEPTDNVAGGQHKPDTPPQPNKEAHAPTRPPEITPADEVTVTTSSSGRASLKGRVMQAINSRRRSSGQESHEEDAFSTQQSLASSSQISGQRASLTAQLARGDLPEEALEKSLLDSSHHSGALLLGRTSSRSTSSQQSNAAAYVGMWRKNLAESDAGMDMEDLLDMPRLQRMVRQRTIVLEVRTAMLWFCCIAPHTFQTQIKDDGDVLEFVWHVRLNGGKEILKAEIYPRQGGPVEGPRRDGREGMQRASAGMSKGYLQVKSVQDEPYGAMFQDRYVLSTHGNRMRIEHKMQLFGGAGAVRSTSVWHRVRDVLERPTTINKEDGA